MCKVPVPLTRSRICSLLFFLQEVDALVLKQPPPKNLQQRQLQLLTQGVDMLYRTQLLVVKGLDAPTKESFTALQSVLQQVQQGSYVPGGPPAAAAAAVGAPAAPAPVVAAAAVVAS